VAKDAIKNAKNAKNAKSANPWRLALLAFLDRAGDLIGAEAGEETATTASRGAAEGVENNKTARPYEALKGQNVTARGTAPGMRGPNAPPFSLLFRSPDGAAEGIAAEAKTPQTSPRRTPRTLRVTWGKTKGNGLYPQIAQMHRDKYATQQGRPTL